MTVELKKRLTLMMSAQHDEIDLHASLFHSARTSPDLVGELTRVKTIITLANEALGRRVHVTPATVVDVSEADHILRSLIEDVGRHLDEMAPTVSTVESTRLRVVYKRACEMRATLQQVELADHFASLGALEYTVKAIRAARSVSDLMELAPSLVVEMGYHRCMLSTIRAGRWVARSCFVSDNSELAAQILEVGSAGRALSQRLVETRIVEARRPQLVSGAQSNSHVDPAFKRVSGMTSYVAAPITVGAHVQGFVHVDSPTGGREVNDFDRSVITLFAESLSHRFEILYYQHRLSSIQPVQNRSLELSATTLDELVTVDPRAADVASTSGTPGFTESDETRYLDVLTPREQEVLAHIADGESNVQIATVLFISETTVKAHIKHIFRKLAITNRAQAVSLYFRLK